MALNATLHRSADICVGLPLMRPAVSGACYVSYKYLVMTGIWGIKGARCRENHILSTLFTIFLSQGVLSVRVRVYVCLFFVLFCFVFFLTQLKKYRHLPELLAKKNGSGILFFKRETGVLYL